MKRSEKNQNWLTQMILSAKPPAFQWQVPQIADSPPKEPPQEIKTHLEDAIRHLPPFEKTVVEGVYSHNFSHENLADILQVKPLLIQLVHAGALERLSTILKKGPAQIVSWLRWWAMHQQSQRAEVVSPASPGRTDRCLPLTRIYEVVLRGDWSELEREHLKDCPACSTAIKRVRKVAWHPTALELCRFLAGHLPDTPLRTDIQYHLEVSRCSRCRERAKRLQIFWQAIARFYGLSPYPLFKLQQSEDEVFKKDWSIPVVHINFFQRAPLTHFSLLPARYLAKEKMFEMRRFQSGETITDLVRGKKFDNALKIAEALIDPLMRQEGLLEIVVGMVEEGKFAEARQLTQKIDDALIRSAVQAYISDREKSATE
ncbi:MAG: hypothetical protein NZ959_11345 [Armatimonadetes bacterium]|nr:hypothetical protein [Armatimonadota bacterium]MDW8122916.1 hypothetical protein [Armatimonadota bacterium]